MKVAVVGATGVVGREVLNLLVERKFPVTELVALGRSSSLGKEVSFGDDTVLQVQNLEDYEFYGTDLVFFCVGDQVSKTHVPRAVEAGCAVIDKSAHFRQDPGVPLVIPEVNGHLVTRDSLVYASPNCVALPLALVLHPLAQIAPLKRVVVSTYQSVSGAGQAAMDELFDGTRKVFMNDDADPQNFPKPIVFNVIPQIDDIAASGVTGEEEKVIAETQRLLGDDIAIACTCVRVPTFIGHALAVTVEFESAIEVDQALAAFEIDTGVMVVDRREDGGYATPLEIAGEDVVIVSRLREDPTVPFGLQLWIVCDNLRKGAALNAVQIAETIFK